MKRTILILTLTVLTTGVNFAQKNIEDIIVGRWVMADPTGDSIKFFFDKNKTMYMSSPKGDIGRGDFPSKTGQKVKSLMKYELNTKEKPCQVDFIIYADNFFNPVSKIEGIVEVLNDNALRISMNFNKKHPGRAVDFTNKMETTMLFRANTKFELTDCQNFKDGKFKIDDPIIGETVIERRGDFQEETDTKGNKRRFKVNWTGSCGYELSQMKTFSGNTWASDTTGMVATINILFTKKKSYLYVITYNKSKFRLYGELTKIKN